MTLNAITMSEDSIALFDDIREGKLTAREIRDLINGLDIAAKRQRDGAIARGSTRYRRTTDPAIPRALRNWYRAEASGRARARYSLETSAQLALCPAIARIWGDLSLFGDETELCTMLHFAAIASQPYFAGYQTTRSIEGLDNS